MSKRRISRLVLFYHGCNYHIPFLTETNDAAPAHGYRLPHTLRPLPLLLSQTHPHINSPLYSGDILASHKRRRPPSHKYDNPLINSLVVHESFIFLSYLSQHIGKPSITVTWHPPHPPPAFISQSPSPSLFFALRDSAAALQIRLICSWWPASQTLFILAVMTALQGEPTRLTAAFYCRNNGSVKMRGCYSGEMYCDTS